MTQPTEAESQRVDKLGNYQGNNRQAAIADVSLSGNYLSDYAATETAINAILAVMRLRGEIAD